MTYQECLNHIDELNRKAYVPNHENSLRLMTYLDHPEAQLKVIHVAGTNGKGSTIQFMKHILIEAGYSVGTFMSPHITSPLELVNRGNTTIREDQFSLAYTTVIEACHEMVRVGLAHPTAFECLTAMALVHFAIEPVDITIVEVGMGGRYDSTNVFSQPLMTLITAIDYDHQQWLGATLPEIASHKAGIIKKNVPTLLGPNPMEVVQVITAEVQRHNGHLYLLDRDLIHVTELMKQKQHQLFHLKTPHFDYKGLQMSMMGQHQYENLALALLAVKTLKKTFTITDVAIKAGIKKTKWTCRNDLISKDPLILIDGGHNLAGIRAIARLLRDTYANHRIITVFGVLADKATFEMLDLVITFSDQVILTEPLNPRALPIESYPEKLQFEAYKDHKKALKRALDLTDSKTLIVVLGSLYLAYPSKDWLIHHLNISR